jgi:predicted transcriptional regulator
VAEDEIEEETYSLIFNTLKQPIRRRILRMLADKPRSYSELLEALAIDSGHLSYHIENLGDIVTHTKDGKYAFSTIGEAAVKLMTRVEEQRTYPRKL